MLNTSGVTLNIPAGMWGKTQFTAEEVAASRNISAARIQRKIECIKNYRILRNKVAHAMLPYLSDVFFVSGIIISFIFGHRF